MHFNYLSKILFFFMFLQTTISAQVPALDWAKIMGANEFVQGKEITLDNYGNSYMTGTYHNTISLDPSMGYILGHSLGGQGSANYFVQTLTPNGNYFGAMVFGGNGFDDIFDVEVDNYGYIYTIGSFEDTVDFNNSSGLSPLVSNGDADIFIQKVDWFGNSIWTKKIGSVNVDIGTAIKLDPNGNVYATGRFSNTVDFDPSVNTYNLTSNGGLDIFICKLDANGNFVWAKNMGSTLNGDSGIDILLDANNNIYTVGNFEGTVDFDPNVTIHNLTSNGDKDAFIQKLDANGNFVWAKSIGGVGEDVINKVILDSNGDIIVVGAFSNTVDFDPNAGIYNLVSMGSFDAFVQKLDTNGNFIWAKSIEGTNDIYYSSLDSDISNNIYLTGAFDGTADFDPSINTHFISSNGRSDIFIQKLNANGDFTWAKNIGGLYWDRGSSIRLNQDNDIYVAGTVMGDIDFDPNSGTYYPINYFSYYQRCFVLKLKECQNTTSIDTITACGSYTWIDGNIYTATNNMATYSIPNAAGCDSIITLNLTITNSVNSMDTIVACNSHTWIDGITYTSNNNTATYTYNLPSGCDSTVTLDLTINNTTSSIDTINACDSYTWIDGITYTTSNYTATDTFLNAAGCDSIVTLHLNINSTTTIDTVFACDSYTWIDGITYTTGTNTATYTTTNAAGCDSTVRLDLTIVSDNFIANDIIQQVSCHNESDGSINLNPTGGVAPYTYSWSNGNTTNMIDSLVAGNYSVTITDANNCSMIDDFSINHPNLLTAFSTITNTTCDTCSDGKIIISVNGGTPSYTYTWSDSLTAITNYRYDLPAGTYTVTVTDNNGCTTMLNPTIYTPTSVYNVEYDLTINIYPNPSNGAVTIELNEAPQQPYRLEIINLLGQVLYSDLIIDEITNLDLSSLSSGTYFIQINGIKTQELVLIRE